MKVGFFLLLGICIGIQVETAAAEQNTAAAIFFSQRQPAVRPDLRMCIHGAGSQTVSNSLLSCVICSNQGCGGIQRTPLPQAYFSRVHANPGRPALPDDPIARHMFLLALGNSTTGNTTTSGYVTEARLHEIFGKFDLNGDGSVNEHEFIEHWNSLHLGREDHATFLFHQADTDRDGLISQNPDISRIFMFFDRNGDHHVSEDEFVLIWYSLSGGDQ